MTGNKIQIIACDTVIKEMLPFMSQGVSHRSVESGLHLRPERLKAELQRIIDETTDLADTIILGFGLCSMAVIGLRAAKSTLVIPRQDDCIGIFLGSRDRYKEELKKEPGTYFLSRGWIDAKITLVDEFNETVKRHDREIAERVMKLILKHYTRLAFINTGHQDQNHYVEFSRSAAKKFGLCYDEIPGKTELLKKICQGPWDEEFVVVPPGRKIRLEDFDML
ncbi:MAG: DUF1638 domain-containing protein [Deltaproteobacteria bacterium]|nr:DUF1638 domain-containing protein [Deltaproteobacteria bacterium]